MEGGVLAEVLVHTGDTVDLGQPVARLDETKARSTVAGLESQLSSTRIELARLIAQSPIDRMRLEAGVAEAGARAAAARTTLRERMVEVGVTGDPDSVARAAGARVHVILDAASAQLNGALAAVGAARAQLAASELTPFDIQRKRDEARGLETQLVAARQLLARHTIVAPSHGVLLTEQVERLVGASVQAGEPFLEIGDLHGWHAFLAVSEHDVHRIHVGDRASIEIPALSAMPSDRFMGRVLSIGWQPAASSTTAPSGPPVGATAGGYRVLVAIDSTELAALGRGVLRRGYAVQGKIITRSGPIVTLLQGYLRDRARSLKR
jgi:multidrug resistance efflux pump